MPETLNQRWAATIVGALVEGGVRHAVVAPGSRSTPLALAFADRPELRVWSIIDERSAAFFALGVAKATQAPVAVVCTSGTAGAHFLPAVIEASEGATPLVVLTANRPWELHGFGAPQTIDQHGLFGRFVRASENLPAPDEAEHARRPSTPLRAELAAPERSRRADAHDEPPLIPERSRRASAHDEPPLIPERSRRADAHEEPPLIPERSRRADAHEEPPLIPERSRRADAHEEPPLIPERSRRADAHEEPLIPERSRRADAHDPALFAHLAALTARVVATAQRAPRGPVHLDVMFREPLAPEDSSAGPLINPRTTTFPAPRLLPRLDEVAAAIATAERGLIVCGPRERDDGFGAAVHALGERLGFPVLAEAASNARFGFPAAISLYDAMLRNARFAQEMTPDVVLRFGGGLTPKTPQAWLDASGARTFVFSDDGLVFDPLHRAEQVLIGDATAACDALREGTSRSAEYRQRWLEAQARAQAKLESAKAELSEPLIARELVAALPSGSALVVSSSMPIRDVDAFAARARDGVRVFANRGVNGIDGVVSTALGVAAGTGRPTALLIGDVAALHDLSAWLAAKRYGLQLTAVVVNNDGGGIFHFLPIAGRTTHFEQLFGTPHGADFAHLAALGGATLHRPAELGELGRTVTTCLEGGLHLVEVRTDRTRNVADHRALFAALSEVT